MVKSRQPAFVAIVIAVVCGSFLAQTRSQVTYLPYAEAKPILQTLAEILPPELRVGTPDQLATLWPSWVTSRDLEIRKRLAQGDEDSLANFLLFGTSYTPQPRINEKQIAEIRGESASTGAHATAKARTILAPRIHDLMRALLVPRGNERLLFARQVLAERGYRQIKPRDPALQDYLLNSVVRGLQEQANYVRIVESARLLGNPSEEFAARSKVYSTRGLSSDTSLLPNYAIEESLKVLKQRGVLAPHSIRRVAIVGPGLDFTDKQSGYDFYPQQTIQPFAIVDSLYRLGLARREDFRVKTFDLSPRVNHHLALAEQRARRGQPYVIQLPRDPASQWKAEAVQYWKRFGDQIGTPTTPVKIPANVGNLEIRAVRVRPEVAAQISPVDLNIVLQYMRAPAAEQFDLIIGTNIFVYYDTFEQSLAMANVERMLRPGGVLLSNNAMLELPFSRVRSLDYLTVIYSDRPDDGDHIVWYQRLPD